MLADGEQLVPGFQAGAGAARVDGRAPAVRGPQGRTAGSTRDVTRAHALLDHRERDGVSGFLTITGGKLTTYRLMAEDTVDAVCRQLGETATVARPTTDRFPAPRAASTYRVGERLGAGSGICTTTS